MLVLLRNMNDSIIIYQSPLEKHVKESSYDILTNHTGTFAALVFLFIVGSVIFQILREPKQSKANKNTKVPKRVPWKPSPKNLRQ